MGNPVYVSYTTTGAKTPINLDYFQSPFSATIGVDVGGGATYGIQYTLDDVNDASVTATWYNDATKGPGATTTSTVSYTFPIRFVRINITAITDTVKFKVLQGVPL